MVNPNAPVQGGQEDEVELIVEAPDGTKMSRRTMIGGTIAAGVASVLSSVLPEALAQERQKSKKNNGKEEKVLEIEGLGNDQVPETVRKWREEELPKFLKIRDDEEWKKTIDPRVEDKRKSRLAEQGALATLTEDFQRVYSSEQGNSDWTSKGKMAPANVTHVYIFRVRIRRNGKIHETKGKYVVAFNQYAIRPGNPFGITNSAYIEARDDTAEKTAEAEMKDLGFPLEKESTLSLDDFTKGLNLQPRVAQQ